MKIVFKIGFIFLLVILLILISFNVNKDNFNTNKSPKKLAFCFLIYDKINNEKIWHRFFENVDKNKYNIYIHYKNNSKLKYFDNHKISNCIDTKWGHSSLVEAQNLLLKNALIDKDNKHFILLSNSCIPVKPFDYIYNFLDPNYSYFNELQVNPFIDTFNLIKRKIDVYKASQWCILNRKHANIILKKYSFIKNNFIGFNLICADEYTYITLLKCLDLLSELKITYNKGMGATTFVSWSSLDNYMYYKGSLKTTKSIRHPNTYKKICSKELNLILKSDSLFARKFNDNCKGLEILLFKN